MKHNHFQYQNYDKSFAEKIQNKLYPHETEVLYEGFVKALPTYPLEVRGHVVKMYEKYGKEVLLMDGVFEEVTNGTVKRGDYDFPKSNSLKASIKRVANRLELNADEYINDLNGNYSLHVRYTKRHYFSMDKHNELEENKVAYGVAVKEKIMNYLVEQQKNYYEENNDDFLKNKYIRMFQKKTGILISVASHNNVELKGKQLEEVYQKCIELKAKYDILQKEARELFDKYEKGKKWGY